MRIVCSAKDSHIFPTKNKCICNINVLNFNETLTNDVVNFEPALVFQSSSNCMFSHVTPFASAC